MQHNNGGKVIVTFIKISDSMDFVDPGGGGGGMTGIGEGGGTDGVENGNGNAEGGSEYSADYDGIVD